MKRREGARNAEQCDGSEILQIPSSKSKELLIIERRLVMVTFSLFYTVLCFVLCCAFVRPKRTAGKNFDEHWRHRQLFADRTPKDPEGIFSCRDSFFSSFHGTPGLGVTREEDTAHQARAEEIARGHNRHKKIFKMAAARRSRNL